ncbi:hypothetical protein [Streptomyces sp. NPDC058268]|uniref:hypothetical protein n=1 Tax=Streptomyces sp. NPDC058268 TaxID=3346413 RepID=UPI0036E55E2A
MVALRALVPRAACFGDFRPPPVDDAPGDLRSGIDRVLATPRRQLRHELSLLNASGGRPPAGAEPCRGGHSGRSGSGLLKGHTRPHPQSCIADGIFTHGEALVVGTISDCAEMPYDDMFSMNAVLWSDNRWTASAS